MKNKETLQAAMDRRLSFLDELPSCRPALMQRIAQEEAPVMKRKISVGLVFALVLVSLSVIALATGLILSPRAVSRPQEPPTWRWRKNTGSPMSCSRSSAAKRKNFRTAPSKSPTSAPAPWKPRSAPIPSW